MEKACDRGWKKYLRTCVYMSLTFCKSRFSRQSEQVLSFISMDSPRIFGSTGIVVRFGPPTVGWAIDHPTYPPISYDPDKPTLYFIKCDVIDDLIRLWSICVHTRIQYRWWSNLWHPNSIQLQFSMLFCLYIQLLDCPSLQMITTIW